MVTSDLYSELVRDGEKYGSKFQDHLLEQYKLYVEMADKISSRRASANEFFLTINTLLLSGLSLTSGLRPTGTNLVLPIFAAIAGISFCVVWIQTVRTYRTLNGVKFDLIGKVESRLPATMYATEWRVLSARGDTGHYRALSDVEKWVPVVFMLLYFFYAITVVLLIAG